MPQEGLGFEDSYLLTGLSTKSLAFIKDNEEQILALIEDLHSAPHITIRIECHRGDVKGYIKEIPRTF